MKLKGFIPMIFQWLSWSSLSVKVAKESDLWYAGDQQGAGSKAPEVLISDHNQKGTIPRKLPGLVNVYKKRWKIIMLWMGKKNEENHHVQ
jgi:hypothetical protein